MNTLRLTAKARHRHLTIGRYASVDGEIYRDSHAKFIPAIIEQKDHDLDQQVSKVCFMQPEQPG